MSSAQFRMKRCMDHYSLKRPPSRGWFTCTLENWLMPPLNEDSNDYILQQDGSPAHYHKDMQGYLKWNMQQRWIGRTGKEDNALMRWPPRSPDLTPCDFFSGGLWRTLSLCLHSPLISRIFATVSLLPWFWSNVICWHVCVEWDGLSHRCLPY
jgi:hypothetical protein